MGGAASSLAAGLRHRRTHSGVFPPAAQLCADHARDEALSRRSRSRGSCAFFRAAPGEGAGISRCAYERDLVPAARGLAPGLDQSRMARPLGLEFLRTVRAAVHVWTSAAAGG